MIGMGSPGPGRPFEFNDEHLLRLELPPIPRRYLIRAWFTQIHTIQLPMAAFLLFNLAAILLSAVAQNITDLQNTLSAHGVSAVYPTDENFTTVSQACEFLSTEGH